MTRDVLAFQFEMNGRSMAMNATGITHADSLTQPSPGGNCCNWVVGHILASRNAVHALLKLPPAWDDATDRYDRNSRPMTDASDAEPLDGLLERLRASHSAIADALAALDDSRLAEPVEGGKPLGMQLAFAAFHESYHVGQLGILRRLLGRDGAI